MRSNVFSSTEFDDAVFIPMVDKYRDKLDISDNTFLLFRVAIGNGLQNLGINAGDVLAIDYFREPHLNEYCLCSLNLYDIGQAVPGIVVDEMYLQTIGECIGKFHGRYIVRTSLGNIKIDHPIGTVIAGFRNNQLLWRE